MDISYSLCRPHLRDLIQTVLRWPLSSLYLISLEKGRREKPFFSAPAKGSWWLNADIWDVIMRGASLSFQEGALCRAAACSLRAAFRNRGTKFQSQPATNWDFGQVAPLLSEPQLPHLQTGAEGQPSALPAGEKVKGRAIWEMPGTQ